MFFTKKKLDVFDINAQGIDDTTREINSLMTAANKTLDRLREAVDKLISYKGDLQIHKQTVDIKISEADNKITQYQAITKNLEGILTGKTVKFEE